MFGGLVRLARTPEQLVDQTVQQQHGLVHQLFRRARQPDQAAEHRQPQTTLLVGGKLLGGVDHHRRQDGLLFQRVQHGVERNRLELDHHGIRPLRLASQGGEVGDHVQVAEALTQQLGGFRLRPDQGDPAPLLGDEALHLVQGGDHGVAFNRLGGEAERSHGQAQAPLVVGRDHVDRNVARLGRALQEVQQSQAVHVGQADVEHDRLGPEPAGQSRSGRALAGDHASEARIAHQLEQDRGEPRIVLDDQHHRVVGRDLVPIVRHRLDALRLDRRQGEGANHRTGRRPRQHGRLSLRTEIQRHVQRKGRTPAGPGGHPEFAAQHAGDLAADRQAQPRAAVLSAGGAVRLLERLEDDPLLVLWDADAGVLDLERQDLAGPVEVIVGRAPA